MKNNKVKKDREPPIDYYVKELEAHCESCKKATEYAITRFDILIIALSSGAIAFSEVFIKDVLKETGSYNYTLIKIAWASFKSAIVLNLFSQIKSYYSNKSEIKIIGSLLKKERGKMPLVNERELECQQKNLNSGTIVFNFLSFSAFLVGVGFLIAFTFTHI